MYVTKYSVITPPLQPSKKICHKQRPIQGVIQFSGNSTSSIVPPTQTTTLNFNFTSRGRQFWPNSSAYHRYNTADELYLTHAQVNKIRYFNPFAVRHLNEQLKLYQSNEPFKKRQRLRELSKKLPAYAIRVHPHKILYRGICLSKQDYAKITKAIQQGKKPDMALLMNGSSEPKYGVYSASTVPEISVGFMRNKVNSLRNALPILLAIEMDPHFPAKGVAPGDSLLPGFGNPPEHEIILDPTNKYFYNNWEQQDDFLMIKLTGCHS